MRRLFASFFLVSAGLSAPDQASAGPAIPPGARAEALSFSSLPGWSEDDHVTALAAFRKTCRVVLEPGPALQKLTPPPGLARSCVDALAKERAGPEEARRFFESWFAPFEVSGANGRGFLTGYYEPEFPGALEPSPEFTTPLLARPDDLVSIEGQEPQPGLPPGTAAARRTPTGSLEAYPDRAAIEDGAIAGRTRPVVYLRDFVDVFIVQVQGSARIRLPDGRAVRVAYAGRNGLPYTSVARLLVQRLGIPPAEMTADALTRWLRENPDEGRALVRQNRSFVFFRIADELDPNEGPIGAAGVPVTSGRTLAVDRTIWSYGLPVWLEGELPRPAGGSEPLRRLVIAQDTGTAIVGPARGDLFTGSGEAAGLAAGLIRQDVRFVVLWPRPEPATAAGP